MAPQRRTAALVISAFVEPEGNPPWYARISYYRDAFAPAVDGPPQTSVDAVCDAVRAWLESVVGAQAIADDDSVTAP
ncbi:MAG TPA: hypothetical protein VN906_09180 [Candidatus Sulfotelmatobacter sp.]|jgi:hypothetical protein|nr:hypothetical protein [Candidatus Sulfotelmatobacter sp.]